MEAEEAKYYLGTQKTLLHNWYVPSDDLTQWINKLDFIFTLDVNLGIGFLAYWICYLKWDFRRKELSKNALSNSRKFISFRPIKDKHIKNWIQLQAKVRGRTFISMGSISELHIVYRIFVLQKFVCDLVLMITQRF